MRPSDEKELVKNGFPWVFFITVSPLIFFLAMSMSLGVRDTFVFPVSERIENEVEKRVEEEKGDIPITVHVEMQTDGWTSYRITNTRNHKTQWQVQIQSPEGKLICGGFSDWEYKKGSAQHYWPADYFVGDDCPDEIPFGSIGVVTYIPLDGSYVSPYQTSWFVSDINPFRKEYTIKPDNKSPK